MAMEWGTSEELVRNEPGFSATIQELGTTTDDDVRRAVSRLYYDYRANGGPKVRIPCTPEAVHQLHELVTEI